MTIVIAGGLGNLEACVNELALRSLLCMIRPVDNLCGRISVTYPSVQLAWPS